MTEPTDAGGSPAQSRVHPMAMLEELAAENDFLRKRCMLLANELHTSRAAVAELQAAVAAAPESTGEAG
ncbi:hypothetical protein [Aliihoeflea sp. PC F10.4]